MNGPSPTLKHPIEEFPQIVFLKNVITNPFIEVGDYTYFDDPNGAELFEQRNVLYHFAFMGDYLRIGRFCSIAQNVRFIMNGGNHSLAGFTNYPFYIFGNGWQAHLPPDESETSKGDTIIGNDVWIGFGATILPGVHIGDGAVIGALAVVANKLNPIQLWQETPPAPYENDSTKKQLIPF